MITKVGLIVVHGIGEQRRFDHLDQQLRGFMEQLRADNEGKVTVEIMGASPAANQATQDTWRAGPDSSVRIILEQGQDQIHFHVHEVWWADVNEPYSVMKQIRFWFWGLSIWWFPTKLASPHPLAQDAMTTVSPTKKDLRCARAQIYWVGSFFLGLSVFFGLFFNLLKRVLNIDAPNIVVTFVNYLSSIKLYNQPVRHGLGLTQPPADFLDALDEAPRVSIRRRMIRTLADVACAGYDRWYVLAHSLGSVVAFNGLMEPAYAFPSYLDQERWDRLTAMKPPMGGLAGAPYTPPPSGSAMSPERPAWLAHDDVAYRAEIFKKFAGLMTYGCPLGKFSAIWPALVPFCREPAFPKSAVWLNVFDPIDPVSGPLDSMKTTEQPPHPTLNCSPPRTNLGYCSSNILLEAHVTYLDRDDKRMSLVELLADWMITGKPAKIMDPKASAKPAGKPNSRFFSEGSAQNRRRDGGKLASWLLVNAVLLALNVLIARAWELREGLPQATKAFFDAFVGTGAIPPLVVVTLAFLTAAFVINWLVGVLDLHTKAPTGRLGAFGPLSNTARQGRVRDRARYKSRWGTMSVVLALCIVGVRVWELRGDVCGALQTFFCALWGEGCFPPLAILAAAFLVGPFVITALVGVFRHFRSPSFRIADADDPTKAPAGSANLIAKTPLKALKKAPTVIITPQPVVGPPPVANKPAPRRPRRKPR